MVPSCIHTSLPTRWWCHSGEHPTVINRGCHGGFRGERHRSGGPLMTTRSTAGEFCRVASCTLRDRRGELNLTRYAVSQLVMAM